MTLSLRVLAGFLLSIATIASATLHADTVQLTIRDGRLSLVAVNATPAQIFDAWSRAGGVMILNAERMPAAPLTIRLDNVPEEQALDTILRSVSGYLARRRAVPAGGGSMFERIVILPTPQGPRPPVTAAAGAVSSLPVSQPRQGVQPPPQNQPQGIPQAPGVTRLVGSDGQPVEDDQAGAPQPFNPGDPVTQQPPVGAPRGAAVPVQVPAQPAQQQSPAPQQPSAPAGVPRPGMVVPGPQSPQQQPSPQPQSQPQR